MVFYQLLENFQIMIRTCFIKSDNVNGLLSIMSPSIKSIVYPASMATNANQASSQTDPAGPNSHVIFLSASNYRRKSSRFNFGKNQLNVKIANFHLKHTNQTNELTFVTTYEPFIPKTGLFNNLKAILCFPRSSATLIESATVHKRF